MPLIEILLLAGLALAIGALAGRERARSLRGWLVLAASVVCLFWLQPSTPIRGLDFWLPTATLALTVLAWLLTAPPAERWTRANALSAGLMAGLVILTGLTRYLGPGDWLAASRPPVIGAVLAGVALLGALLYGLAWILRRAGAPKAALPAAIVVLIALLVVLKTPQLSLLAAQGLRGLAGQKAELATALDLRWLGFSYICFRLIHTLRDRQTGRLPAADLRTFTSYVIFFPSLLAGPIDRLERFQRDFDVSPGGDARGEQWTQAGRRLVLGLAKKFIIADTLALVALSPQNAPQVSGAGWMWLLLYIYALQIYFDFSGYTDIAISLGLALGVKLPENFAAPYLKPNLTQFWNAWHMSLTQWFRAYYFNPLVRWLRGSRVKASPGAVLLVTQISTFLLIGLWHGVTLNFALWGLWHGLGLFVQNRWTESTRVWFAERQFSPAVQRGLAVFSTLLTFHYVALGWVWFALPTPRMALAVLCVLGGG